MPYQPVVTAAVCPVLSKTTEPSPKNGNAFAFSLGMAMALALGTAMGFGGAGQAGGSVLILGMQKIVVLEMPKTGSLALRAMLAPYTLPASDRAARHIGYDGFLRKHAPDLAAGFGRTPQTVAVVRDPLSRMQSWYRYRRRAKVKGLPASTHGISFDYFMRAYLDGIDPQMSNVGRQDRFVGWNGRAARVDHLFDYKQLPLMEAFFSLRVGTALTLPQKNITPKTVLTDYTLDEATLERFHAQNLAEIELYKAVAGAGHLMRPGVSA